MCKYGLSMEDGNNTSQTLTTVADFLLFFDMCFLFSRLTLFFLWMAMVLDFVPDLRWHLYFSLVHSLTVTISCWSPTLFLLLVCILSFPFLVWLLSILTVFSVFNINVFLSCALLSWVRVWLMCVVILLIIILL